MDVFGLWRLCHIKFCPTPATDCSQQILSMISVLHGLNVLLDTHQPNEACEQMVIVVWSAAHTSYKMT